MTASAYGARVWQFSRLLNDCLAKVLEPVSKRYGLTALQAQLLFSVHRHGGATVGTVAEKLGLARTNVSAMCKKLANMGFLHRHRRDDDERIVFVVLTDAGRTAAAEIENQIEAIYKYRNNDDDITEINKMIHMFEEISDLLMESEETK